MCIRDRGTAKHKRRPGQSHEFHGIPGFGSALGHHGAHLGTTAVRNCGEAVHRVAILLHQPEPSQFCLQTKEMSVWTETGCSDLEQETEEDAAASSKVMQINSTRSRIGHLTLPM